MDKRMDVPETPQKKFFIQPANSNGNGSGPLPGSFKTRELNQKREDNTDTRVLTELERLRVELLNSISTELTSSLRSIKETTAALLRTDFQGSEEKIRSMIRLIHQELDRLSRVVNGIVESTRLEGGVFRLEKDSCRIEDLFSDIADKLQEFTRHHYLQLVLPSKLPPVLIDRKKIQQVILNLVHHAVKYSREGSPIIIEARNNREYMTISVTDQGIGIPAQLQARLFDHFSQADNIIRRHKDQNDIGLPVCRGIIEAHGGKIQIVSQAGTGSRFSFQLPYIIESNRL
jgi:K+-sensing histidine kinase KdpD